jgi:hypothetical protein
LRTVTSLGRTDLRLRGKNVVRGQS